MQTPKNDLMCKWASVAWLVTRDRDLTLRVNDLFETQGVVAAIEALKPHMTPDQCQAALSELDQMIEAGTLRPVWAS